MNNEICIQAGSTTFRFDDVQGDDWCLFHSIAKDPNCPIRDGILLKQTMASQKEILRPFHGSLFNYHKWYKDFDSHNYWGTEIDMLLFSMIFEIELVCITHSYAETLPFRSQSSYAIYDTFCTNFPSSNVPRITKKKHTQYLYLHVASKPCHAPGYYNTKSNCWFCFQCPSDLPAKFQEDEDIITFGDYERMKPNHYACLHIVSVENTSGSFIYWGGLSIQQIQGELPANLAYIPDYFLKSTRMQMPQHLQPKKSRSKKYNTRAHIRGETKQSSVDNNLQSKINSTETEVEDKHNAHDCSNSVLVETVEEDNSSDESFTHEDDRISHLDEGIGHNTFLCTDSCNLDNFRCPPKITSTQLFESLDENSKSPQNLRWMGSSSEKWCNNCNRYEIQGSEQNKPYKIGFRTASFVDCYKETKQYCFLPKQNLLLTGSDDCVLCMDCFDYLSQKPISSTVGPKAKARQQLVEKIWPCFIWSVLRETQLFLKGWSLLPDIWRPWWIRAICRKHSVSPEFLSAYPPLFDDVTVETQKDLDALKNLRWGKDIIPREISLLIPSIKCPAGCSEWKHKANGLPIDIVWQHLLQTPLQIYSPIAQIQCTNWFRDDYLTVEFLLYNKAWKCKASIAQNLQYGYPEVCACRYHTVSVKTFMLHPPRNPTGMHFDETANKFAPVTAIPRTVQKTKAHAYSASFQMAALQGSFEGIDTMFLSIESPQYWNMTFHGLKRDSLSIAARSDLKNHITKLQQEGAISTEFAESLMHRCYQSYPNLHNILQQYCSGSTYISSIDALCLQKQIKLEGSETAILIKDGKETQIPFVTPWPKYLTWIHPCNDPYGRVPPPMKKMLANENHEKDTRVLWTVACMILTIPELWLEVSNVPKMNIRWEPYMLTYLISNSLIYMSNPRTKNPFNNADQKLLADMISPTNTFNIDDISRAFHSMPQNGIYEKVICCVDGFKEPVSSNTDVVIVINKDRTALITIDSKHIGWELRFVAFTKPNGKKDSSVTAFVRHGRNDHMKWWKIDRNTAQAVKSSFDANNKQEYPADPCYVCIYVKRMLDKFYALKRELLSSCSGQCNAYCKEHKCPLICVPSRKYSKCTWGDIQYTGPCQNDSIYACPELNCLASICKKHFEAMKDCECYYIPSISKTDNAILVPSDSSTNYNEEKENSCPLTLLEGQEEDAMDRLETKFLLMESEAEKFCTDGRYNDIYQNEDCGITDAENSELEDDYEMYTTDAGVEPQYTEIANEPYHSSRMTNHALLNCFGGCLLRRNHQLKGTLKQRNFMQRLVASHCKKGLGESIPLLYPEAMLFTDIFYAGNSDGSISGALPSALHNDDRILQRYGYAGLKEHFRTRISHPGLLCTSNPKYHFFAFDNIANLDMRGCDSRMILRRGFADNQGKGGVRWKGNKEPIFDTENVDSRKIVNQVAAAISEKQPSYFYTHTCNMKCSFGIKHIWRWLQSDDYMAIISDGTETDTDRRRLQKNAFDSAGAFILRAWMEINDIWLRYITKSPEKPLGTIRKYVCRAEMQEEKGNVPHFHMIFWTDDDISTKKGLHKVLDRIRGYVNDIIRPYEQQQYIDEGIFSGYDAIVSFLDMMANILPHHHMRRCFVTKKNQNDSTIQTVLKCKVPDNFHLNPTPAAHNFITIPITHSQDAIHVMQQIGVAKEPPLKKHRAGTKLELVPLIDSLYATKHIPPAHGNEGIISPVPGRLVALNPSSDNIQFTTGYTLARYLAKYVVSVDKYNVIRIRPPQQNSEPNTFEVQGEKLLNTKITSNNIAQKNKGANTSRTAKSVECRAINIVELYMQLYDYLPVKTNIEYVYVPTAPYDERAGKCKTSVMQKIKAFREKQKQKQKDNIQLEALTMLNTIPCHHFRQDKLCPERQFAPTQVRKAFDEYHSTIALDSVTVFGYRPPELRFIMHQTKYAKWFKRTPNNSCNIDKLYTYCEKNLHEDLPQSSWLDITASIIRIRAAAIDDAISYLELAPLDDFHNSQQFKSDTLYHFLLIKDAILVSQGKPPLQDSKNYHMLVLDEILQTFVTDLQNPDLPVIWYRTIRPTLTNRFLIGTLLSLGSFVDEYDLFGAGTLRNCFIKARLLDPLNPIDSAKKVMKLYFLEHMTKLPSGTYTFDLYCTVAYETIMSLFVHDSLRSYELPSVMYNRLQIETSQKVRQYIEEKDQALITTLHKNVMDSGIPGIPPLNDFLNAKLQSSINFDISQLSQAPGQPTDSHQEQKQVLTIAKNQIDHYKSAPDEYTKGVCVIGAGGVGKTFTGLICTLLYAVSVGLNILTTSQMAERSTELAGEHLASLLGLNSNDVATPGQRAERAIQALYRNPEKLEYLRLRDLIGIDESGYLPAEDWSVLDIVLRYIRESNKPYGGVLLMATQDHLQIDPVKGRHCLLTPLFTGSFLFVKLQCSVRAAADKNWQRVQEITRMRAHELEDDAIREEFVNLLLDYCSWYDNYDDPNIPPNSLYVFGKHKPIKDIEAKLFQNLEEMKITTKKVVALDEEKTVNGTLTKAKPAVSAELNQKVKEPQVLHLYLGGKYQITYNKKQNCKTVLRSTQLAILFDMPSDETLKKFGAIKMVVAPAGNKYIPDKTDSKEKLLSMGWKEKTVSAVIPRLQVLRSGIRAQRKQYGLKHYVGSTLHATMGATLKSLICEVKPGNKSEPYSLWTPAQGIVLLSRTKTAKDTIFVSKNPRETAEALYDLLKLTTPFKEYLGYLIDQLTGSSKTQNIPYNEIDYAKHIFCPHDVPLPSDNTGVVYILMSRRDYTATYIGSTKNIAKRLNEHNRGVGAKQTASTRLRPWVLLAYVSGFDCNYNKCLLFENMWIAAKEEYMENRHIRHSVEGIVNLCTAIIPMFRPMILTLLHCGTLQLIRQDIEEKHSGTQT